MSDQEEKNEEGKDEEKNEAVKKSVEKDPDLMQGKLDSYISFHTAEFSGYKAPAQLTETKFFLDDVPIIPEWAYGESATLLFTTLDSCIGFVGKKSKDELIGIHLSELNQWDEQHWNEGQYVNQKAYQDLLIKHKSGIHDCQLKCCFGGNQQPDWYQRFSYTWIEKHYPVISNDASQHRWFFYIDAQGSIQAHKWQTK